MKYYEVDENKKLKRKNVRKYELRKMEIIDIFEKTFENN